MGIAYIDCSGDGRQIPFIHCNSAHLRPKSNLSYPIIEYKRWNQRTIHHQTSQPNTRLILVSDYFEHAQFRRRKPCSDASSNSGQPSFAFPLAISTGHTLTLSALFTTSFAQKGSQGRGSCACHEPSNHAHTHAIFFS